MNLCAFALSLLASLAVATSVFGAEETVVNFRSFKVQASSGVLSASAADPSIPFPEVSPEQMRIRFVLHTKQHPEGLEAFSNGNVPGEDAIWQLKSSGKRKWLLRDPKQPVSKFSLAEDGSMKIRVEAQPGYLMPSEIAPMLLVVEDVGLYAWKFCARFESADVLSFDPLKALKVGASSGSANIISCANPVYEGCGDGEIDAGELCDDYNRQPGDGCSSTCQPEICGNGTLDEQEDCDDGNTVAGDSCPADCAICGTDKVAGNEDCDPPFSSDGTDRLCADDCTLAVCGDNVVEAGEDCEPASGLDTQCPGLCGSGGALACSCPDSCNNGLVDGSEDCDPYAPRASWSGCPGDEEGYGAVRCTSWCTCCNESCGLGGLGCCGAASMCTLGPLGRGHCSYP